MSTSTTNYGFIKPEIAEPSGEEIIQANIKKTDKVLKRIDGATLEGRNNRHMVSWYRSAALTGVTASTETTVGTIFWRRINGSATATQRYEVDQGGNGTGYGITYADDWSYLEFYTPGYWRVTWNLRLTMSNSTYTEGVVRAGLLHYSSDDDAWNNFPQPPYTKLLQNSLATKNLNRHDQFTDIGGDGIFRIANEEEGYADLRNSGGSNQYPFSGAPFYGLYLGFAHYNDSAATASVNNTGQTYFHAEWVRGL